MMRYRPNRSKAEHIVKKILRADAHKSQGGRCIYCYEPMTAKQATADHVKARHSNGQTTRDNIVAACKPCNKLKGSMGAAKFRRLIKNPPADASLEWHMAKFRRKLWLQTWRAENRIRGYVGLEKIDLPSLRGDA